MSPCTRRVRNLPLFVAAMMICLNIQAAELSIQDLEAQALKLYQEGHNQEAIPLEERAVALSEKVNGPVDPRTANSLSRLAAMYSAAKAFEKAEGLYQRVVSIREKVLGPEDPTISAALNSLAELYRKVGAYAKAQPIAERALAIAEKIFGPEHLYTGAMLDNLGVVYEEMGAYAKAESLYQRALGIAEKTRGAEHPTTALVLEDLAMVYEKMGAYSKAEPLYQRVLSIRETVRGPEHPDTAVALDHLAMLYDVIGAYSKAEPLYQRALQICEKVLGPDHTDTAVPLSHLAGLYVTTGAYTKAEPLYQRAYQIREKALGPEHLGTGGSLYDLGGLYKATGAYRKALPLYERALAIAENVLGQEHPDTAVVLDDLANLYTLTGAYTKAESLYQRALAIDENALGPEHPDTASTLNDFAGLYKVTGEYTKSESLYKRALGIRENILGPEHPDTASTLNNLAGLYVETGAYAKAEPLYQQALGNSEKIFGSEHRNTAAGLHNLASLYEATGAYAKAEPFYQRALAIAEKVLGPGHPDTASVLDGLAGLYEATGSYAKAEELNQRALAISEEVLGPEHPNTATTLNNLAGIYLATGAYTKAEPLYQRSLAISEKTLSSEHPDIARTLDDLARLYHANGEYAKAESLRTRAQGIEERNTQRFLVFGSEARQHAYLKTYFENTSLDVTFSLAHPAAQSTSLALTTLLRYKGRVLDSMSQIATRLRASLASEDQAIFDQLSFVARELSTLMYSPSAELSFELRKQRLDALSHEQDELQAELASRSVAFREAEESITLEEVRKSLPDHAMLLEWIRYQPFDAGKRLTGELRYAVFMLARNGEPMAIDLGPAKPVEDLVIELRRALSDPNATYYKDVAQELAGKLIQPLASHLMPGDLLLLSTDAALNLVPFAALVDEHGDYLAQHYEIDYLTSGRDLLRFGSEPAPKSGAVVLANPEYGPSAPPGRLFDAGVEPVRSADLDRSGFTFASLPGTGAEAAKIRSLLKLDARHVLTGARATEASLRDLHGPRILHLATHAFFLSDQDRLFKPEGFEHSGVPLPVDENPLLRSGLALAGANGRQSGKVDDGILTAAEVAQLDLTGTQLAVLSACETGLGTVETGEGVYGLRRALGLAGAQAQLVSLWKVADSATQKFMVDYYKNLLRGDGRSAALRLAQLKMMGSPVHKHPYYWAAFVPVGDWRPLGPDPTRALRHK